MQRKKKVGYVETAITATLTALPFSDSVHSLIVNIILILPLIISQQKKEPAELWIFAVPADHRGQLKDKYKNRL